MNRHKLQRRTLLLFIILFLFVICSFLIYRYFVFRDGIYNDSNSSSSEYIESTDKSPDAHSSKRTQLTATFYVDDEVYLTAELYEGDTLDTPTDPIKQGFTFTGWHSGDQLFDFSTKLYSDISLYARFKKDEAIHTVTFKPENDTDWIVYKVEDGRTVTKPMDPAKEGFEFKGWYYGDKTFDFKQPIRQDLVLVALYEPSNKPIEIITIIFKQENGNRDLIYRVEKGSIIQEPPIPQKEGYQFRGWYINDKKLSFPIKATRDVSITAKFDPIMLKVKFLPNNGTKSFEQTVKWGETASEPQSPSRPGYVFIGWYKGETKFDFTAEIYQSITLSAKYRSNTVIVTFDPKNGTQPFSEELQYGQKASEPSTPVKECHTFAGWYDGDTKFNFETKIVRNYALEAHWSLNNSYGDVNCDGKIDASDNLLLMRYVTGAGSKVTDQGRKNADIDLDGFLSYNDARLLSRYLSGESITLGNIQNQVSHMIPGDYSLDGKVNNDDYKMFQQYLNITNREEAPYILKGMDLISDNTLNARDLSYLNRIVAFGFDFVSGEEWIQIKNDNHFNHSDDYVIERTTRSVNGVIFSVYYVFNIKTSLDFISEMRSFASSALSKMALIDMNVLQYIHSYGTSVFFLGGYDADANLLSVGRYTYAGFLNPTNRAVVIGFNHERLNSEYYHESLIHETGHAYDYTLRYTLTGVSGSGISRLNSSQIASAASQIRNLFVYGADGQPYSWSDLAAREAESLKMNVSGFSTYSLDDLLKKPQEFFAEAFKAYYKSGSMRESLRTYAPLTYESIVKIVTASSTLKANQNIVLLFFPNSNKNHDIIDIRGIDNW